MCSIAPPPIIALPYYVSCPLLLAYITFAFVRCTCEMSYRSYFRLYGFVTVLLIGSDARDCIGNVHRRES